MKYYAASGNRYLIQIALVLLSSTILRAGAPVYSQPNVYGEKSRVLLEVIQSGKGMVTPRHSPRVFLRLYENGVIEYEARTAVNYVKRRSHVTKFKVNEIVGLAAEPNLLAADERYSSLEDLGDALLIIKIRIFRENSVKEISIRNYMPDHPKARGFYPPSLVELLRKVEEVRPQTLFERKHGLGQLGLPPG
jgi:hypothetical protein